MTEEYRVKSGDDALTIPLSVLSRLADAGETDLKVLLALAAGEKGEALLSSLGIEDAETRASVAFWRGAGILEKKRRGKEKDTAAFDAAPAPEEKPASASGKRTGETNAAMAQVLERLPEYTSDDVERLCESDRLLRSIFDEAQEVYGKVFNNQELNYIIAMRDHLGLDGEYILMLLQYFRAEGKPLCYAVRTADSLVKQGVDSPAALEEYIRRRDVMRGEEGRYRDLFGIGARRLTSYEEKYFFSWIEQKIPFELVKLAFDRTTEKKGVPHKNYMNGILSRWVAAGYRTAAEVLSAEEEKRTAGTQAGNASVGSFDAEDFFSAALARTYGKKD